MNEWVTRALQSPVFLSTISAVFKALNHSYRGVLLDPLHAKPYKISKKFRELTLPKMSFSTEENHIKKKLNRFEITDIFLRPPVPYGNTS